MNYKFDGSKVFFTSDTHFLYRNFSQKKILKFCMKT